VQLQYEAIDVLYNISYAGKLFVGFQVPEESHLQNRTPDNINLYVAFSLRRNPNPRSTEYEVRVNVMLSGFERIVEPTIKYFEINVDYVINVVTNFRCLTGI
jgi:hypothetical protein